MDDFSVDCSHPYVSVLAMLGNSPDQMVGVAGLKLCNGDSWKNSVKVCAELFSTATRSGRVAPCNSVQFKNCSFGYYEFDLLESTDITPRPESCTCQPKGMSHQCGVIIQLSLFFPYLFNKVTSALASYAFL